jgi:uncharacterized protein
MSRAGVRTGEVHVQDGQHPPPPSAAFRQVVLKVHSRCNLACDYCYVYEHADQGWRDQPRSMSRRTIDLIAGRLAEHVVGHELRHLSVVLHGGEPLLAGPRFLDHAAGALRAAVAGHATLRLQVQTNGVLLDESFLEVFLRHDIRVGVSVDGDRDASDRHRLLPRGGSSHARVEAAIERLRRPPYGALYSGLLSVVDLANDPAVVYRSLLAFDPPRLDLLLPHGNWTTRPPGRPADGAGHAYADWLISVFDLWYDDPGGRTDIRLFSSIMSLLAGGRSRSELVGLDPVDVVTVQTDGTVDLGDALRTTVDGMARTGLSLSTMSLDDVARHAGFRAQRGGLAVLSDQCRACPLVRVCGGGLHAHRYRAATGFDNPSVYCSDLSTLIRHIARRLRADLDRVRAAGAA